MLRTLLCLLSLAVVTGLMTGGLALAQEEGQEKAEEATITKVAGDKVTLKVNGKEQTVDALTVKIMRGKDLAKVSDLKEGDKVRVNLKDGKITVIRIGPN